MLLGARLSDSNASQMSLQCQHFVTSKDKK